MQIITPQSREEWDYWILQNTNHHSFGQSWEWGEILTGEGKWVDRYVFKNDGAVVAQVQTINTRLPFGWVYAFCPKGPIIRSKVLGGRYEVYNAVGDYLRDKGCVFFRFEPSDDDLSAVSYKLKASLDINPRATVILELAKDEEKLLAEMHPKTRYNIRLAEKKNLRVDKEKNEEVFYELMRATGARDGFRLHPRAHYHKILNSPMSRQITIYFGDRPVAVGVFVGFGDSFTYLYGASDYGERALMAPYLVQWEGIRWGKQLGHAYYDFFGIAPGARNVGGEYEYDAKHQYAGVTKFKLGFGGETIVALGTVDIIIDERKYKIYKILRWLRRMI